jgi:hypothetical protein
MSCLWNNIFLTPSFYLEHKRKILKTQTSHYICRKLMVNRKRTHWSRFCRWDNLAAFNGNDLLWGLNMSEEHLCCEYTYM